MACVTFKNRVATEGEGNSKMVCPVCDKGEVHFSRDLFVKKIDGDC